MVSLSKFLLRIKGRIELKLYYFFEWGMVNVFSKASLSLTWKFDSCVDECYRSWYFWMNLKIRVLSQAMMQVRKWTQIWFFSFILPFARCDCQVNDYIKTLLPQVKINFLSSNVRLRNFTKKAIYTSCLSALLWQMLTKTVTWQFYMIFLKNSFYPYKWLY